MNTAESEQRLYNDGSYLANTGGTWHIEDSPFKAQWIRRMLARHRDFQPATVCEIGCGAGAILAELQKMMPDNVSFTGYEMSPQASALSKQFANAHCRYIYGDAFTDPATYDFVLVMDVIEHVEDCFAFMRKVKQKGRMKLYHIPLDAHASAILRGVNGWDSFGHLHLFTLETALKTVEHTGHRIHDCILTDVACGAPAKAARTRWMNMIRYPIACVSEKFATRLVGGYSVLILAE